MIVNGSEASCFSDVPPEQKTKVITRVSNSLVCTAAIIKNIHRSTSDRSVIEVDCEPVIDLISIRKIRK